jgi:hypothetical protein
MAPPRFTSGALITRNNFDALDGGFPRPRPVGGRERGGGKRDGADRALDSYVVPLPPRRHTSAGLLAHLSVSLWRHQDPW